MLINASIQVVPITEESKALPVIDGAIALIQQSGLKYAVGAFATDIEGEYEEVQALLRKVEDYCYAKTDCPVLVYTKVHLQAGVDVTIAGKVGKFRR
ncbi:MAG: thiamine-binding protein [Chitinophagales bacterium]